MNILHTETLKGWGGQQNKVIKELIHTKELGHTVYLLANPNAQIIEKAKLNDINVITLKMTKKTIFTSILFLLKLIKKLDLDLIVSHGSTDSWIVALTKIFCFNKIHIIRERHNMYEIKGLISKLQHRYLFDYIIAISDVIKDYLIELKVKKEKILMLPSVVDIKKFQSINSNIGQEYNIPEDAVVIGIFTSLRKDKGLMDFFEMTKSILNEDNNIYVIYGGRYRENDFNEIMGFYKSNNYDMTRIKWTGYREDSANVMKSFDVFVFPSYSEGLGTVILEAMACKLPVVVYDKRPMSDLVKSNENGYVAKYKDTNDLTIQVKKLISNKQTRINMGEESFKKVFNTYDEKNIKNHLNKILEKINE